MGERIGDETIEIEATVERTSDKAWLINDMMSGKQIWLPKSVGTIIQERDDQGHVLFNVKQWWAKDRGLI